MRTVVYGFFRDEMRGSHNYREVFRWMCFFFFVDLIMPLLVDPFFTEGNQIIFDVIEADDILPIFFLALIPLIYFTHYKVENGFAMVQAMFLYVFLLGWLPLIFEELFFYDAFYMALFIGILIDYLILYEEDELDDIYDEAV
jgi:hypothetical protein